MNKPVMSKGAELFEQTMNELNEAQSALNSSYAGNSAYIRTFDTAEDHAETMLNIADFVGRRADQITRVQGLADQIAVLIELGYADEYREYMSELYASVRHGN